MANKWRGKGRGGFKKLTGARAGAIAVKVAQCRGCGLQCRPGEKPKQCLECGRMDFYWHDSTAEASRSATLSMLEKRGKIEELERQVRFPLFAARLIDGKWVHVKVAVYVADFVYIENGKQVIEDVKGGMTDVASLKLRWMEAMGLPVKLTT